jgi:putative OPT family oligopeptide transporter
LAEIKEMRSPESTIQPYISPYETRAEFTPRAVLLGGFFGILFGAVTVYVGLRAGLTVSASIPIAVLSISILRAFGKASILENNIVQTTGSAGESVAGGVIFTVPALIFLGFPMEVSRIFLLALVGGWLGVFFMIPLRRQLIVKEHENLLYPEGTACADVLIAGDKGGSFASRVFMGLGIGGVYTFFQNENLFASWSSTPTYDPSWLPGSSIRGNTTSEYLGVGYIIGPRIAGVIFAGGVMAWMVVMPTIKFFGSKLAAPLYPGTKLIADMSPSELASTYIRPIGAGAVAAAGLITLLKTMPTIIGALKAGMKDFSKSTAEAASEKRTDSDLSMKIAMGGVALVLVMIVLMLTFKPVPGAYTGFLANICAAIFIVIFGFLFVTVSSRITGLIGTSSNPISGMAIATLMATCAVFLLLGWTAAAYGALAITIGGVVCIASANAGNTSQDLKTGFLVGATPRYQQMGLMIGVFISVLAIGYTLRFMNQGLEQIKPFPARTMDVSHLPTGIEDKGEFKRDKFRVTLDSTKKPHVMSQDEKPGADFLVVHSLGANELPDGDYLYNTQTKQVEYQWVQGIGSEDASAPQAKLMSTIINGILNHRLPWGLVLIGVFLVIGVELLGVRSLSFAVGFYIPMATTLIMFVGGIVRWLVERQATKRGGTAEESDVSPGSLFASGLIAAGGIVGLTGIGIKLAESWDWITPGKLVMQFSKNARTSDIIGVITFAALAFALYHFANKPLDESAEVKK